jgi:hypothetical protein
MRCFAHSLCATVAGIVFVAAGEFVSLAHAEDGGGVGAGAGAPAGAGAGSGSTGAGHGKGVAGKGEGEGGEGDSSSSGAAASAGPSSATAAASSGGAGGSQRLSGFSTGGGRSARTNAADRGELRSEQNMARDAVSRGQIHPLDSILRNVESVVPGSVLSARLRKDGAGAWIYSLVILSPDGHYHRVAVDAVTNAMITSK